MMFADIEGYTALFQRDEASAIRQVNDHRQDLEQATQKHKGEIIQFYGDGSATIFDSVLDAVHCAIDIQNSSAKSRIPVRIGIHMGDLIVKDGDIFGDVVNIASRIQSAGVPGSILVSRKVVDELVNHPNIHTARIGMFSLKNVNKRIELFAVAERGLAIPPMHVETDKRKITPWYYLLLLSGGIVALTFWLKNVWSPSGKKTFEKELICIPPFKDHTQDPDFDDTGLMVASLVSRGLNEVSEANVVSYESLVKYFNSDLTPLLKNPIYAKRTGARLSLDGHYKLTGVNKDSLYFWGDLIDLRTKEVIIQLPTVTCAANTYEICAADIINFLAGYWKSRESNVFTIPNGKAWDAYRKALEIWGDENKLDQAYRYLLESIREDSNFLDAHFLLLDYFNNADQFENEKDSLELIRSRFPNMNDRQSNFLQYYEEDLKGRNTEAYKYFAKEYAMNPQDLMTNITGMVLASEYLNDPALTLRMHHELGMEEMDLNVCKYCRTKANMALQAYLDISDYDNAGKIATQLKPYAEKRAQVSKLILYYLTIGDTSTVNDMIRVSPQMDSTWDIRQSYYRYAAQYALVLGKQDLGRHYSDKALDLYGKEVNWKVGWCYFLKGDYAKAEKVYVGELKKDPNNRFLLGDLGIIYARQGKTEKANEMISLLEKNKKNYDLGDTPYAQGRIKANLGDTIGAIKYLNQSIDSGKKFGTGTNFHYDPSLIGLFDNKDFIKLLGKNRPVSSNK